MIRNLFSDRKGKCTNSITHLHNRRIDDIEKEADVLFYNPDGTELYYCFEASEVDFLLLTGRNPWTGHPFTLDFIRRLKEYKNSKEYQHSMAISRDIEKSFINAYETGNIAVLMKLRPKLSAKIVRTDDNRALRIAAEYGYLDILKYLKEEFGLTAKDARANDNFALRYAAQNGHLNVVKYLKEGFGLKKDDAFADNGFALRAVVRNKHNKIIEYFEEGFGVAPEEFEDLEENINRPFLVQY